MNNLFIEAHIADIHFGVINPVIQLNILQEQFIRKIEPLNLDIISVDGDLFDKKFLANNEVITCVNLFIKSLIELSVKKNCSLILIHGTESHDAHQFNLFYQYKDYPGLDLHIIEQTQFINIKGKRILCIPEEYNKGKEYYKLFFRQQEYDACYLHGTFVHSIYGKDIENLDSNREPVFSMKNFWRCKGPIIAGHVHIAQCLEKHFYYTGSPIRWMFGEEQPKGFLILLHNIETCQYHIHFEEIKSFRYDTVDLDALLIKDPNEVIKYLEELHKEGIDHIRIQIKKYTDNLPIIREYFRNASWIKIDDKTRMLRALEKNNEAIKKYDGLDFLVDPKLDEYTKFVMYVNHQEGEEFISVNELKKILRGE